MVPFVSRRSPFLFLASFAVALLPGAYAQVSPRIHYSTAHRDSAFSLTQTLAGPAKLTARLNAQRSGISVAVTSFHRSGTQDLLTGYATSTGGALVMQNGASEALAPTKNEMPAIIAGRPIVPFHENAATTELPVRPDLLLAGGFRGDGSGDVLTAQRGDRSVYYLAGDGNGGFATPRQLALRGGVSAIGTWRGPAGELLLVAAVDGGKGASGLQVLTLTGDEISFLPLAGGATSLASASVNNAGVEDLIFVVDGRATVLDGDSILTGVPHLETLGGANAVAVATGHFSWDKRGLPQLAVLSSDATLRLYARPGIDTSDITPEERLAIRKAAFSRRDRDQAAPPHLIDTGWNEIENIPGMGSGNDPNALLLHGRLTVGGMEDLLVLTRGQYIEVAHPIVADGSLRTTPASVTVDSTPTPVVAAVAARLSPDSRLGVVTTDATLHPLVTLPGIRTRYYVNITSDAYHSPSNCSVSNNTTCSLRDALVATTANRQTGYQSSVDYIYVAASTTLATQNSNTDAQGDVNYHFNVETSVNITGVGSCTLSSTFPTSAAASCPIVIDGASKDLIFSINSNSTGSTYNPYAVFLSNMQLQNGVNSNNPNGAASGNYAANFGGLIYMDVDGSGSLTLNDMVLTKGTANYNYNIAGGGCLGILNGGAPTLASVELDNSTFNACKATYIPSGTSGVAGGGMILDGDTTLTANNDIWTSNSASLQGGGLYTNGSSVMTGSTITGNLFKSNTAGGDGGGISFESGVTINDSTFMSNSMNGTQESTTGGGGGGGVSLVTSEGAVSLNYDTFTGNTVTSSVADGAGVLFVGSSASGTIYNFSMNYSRIHGNTGGVSGTQGLAGGMAQNTGPGGRTVITATNNWWGCNTDPQSAPANCDAAKVYSNSGTLTTSPFTTLLLKLSSTTPTAGTSFNATGSLGQNSSGTVYTLAQDVGYDGVTAAIAITQNSGSSSLTNSPGATLTSTANSAVSDAAIYATATASSSGTGLATTTVDNCTIKDVTGATPTCNSATTTNFTVYAPDLVVTSAHSGNFKAGDTGDTYTLTVANVGNASTSGTVVLTDALPGFTATALSGTGWTCTLSSVTCTRSDTLNASVTYPVVTVTVSVASTDIGTYSNMATVAGGGELNNNNDTGSDSTIVVGPPTLTEGFVPSTIAPNASSRLNFLLRNLNANNVTLSGIAFTDNLPTGLRFASPSGVSTNCSTGTPSAADGGTQLTFTGGQLSSEQLCSISVSVTSSSIGTYPNPSLAPTSSQSNAGVAATATLTVAVTPTRLVYTSVPPSPITAGGNAGTVSAALEDSSGNVATNNTGTSVTLTVTGPSGYSQTYSGTTTNGVVSFNLPSVPLTVAGSYTYTASATGLTSGTATETVNPGATVSLATSGFPGSTSAQLAGTVTIIAIDSYGNTVTGFTGTVTVTTTDTTAALSPASYTYTASDAGSHVFSVTFNTAGTYSITATSGSYTGSEIGIVVGDAIWVLANTGQRTEIAESGTGIVSAIGTNSGTSTYGGLAIDASGNVWSVASAVNALAFSTYTGGSATTYTGGGLSTPVGVAIDGLGYIWVANSGSYTVSEFSPTGNAVSPAAGFSTTAGTSTAVTAPSGIAIDISGSVWTVNATGNTVTRILGAAAPVVSPIAAGIANKTQGARP